MDSVRIDKWLWAARFFKTRALASKACEIGRVLSNGVRSKPSRIVKLGDRLRIENEGGTWEIDVQVLSEIRGPSAQALTLYLETEAGKAQRLLATAQKKAMAALMPLPDRRPTKRDRRHIIRFREGG
jgi:ribosome-associated heat shock protein Hsp15